MNKPKGLGKPKIGTRGVRLGILGQTGTGKSEFVFGSATKMAKVYAIDTEGGSQFYNPEEHHGFEVINTKSPLDAISLLQYVEQLYFSGEKVIFAIDSYTGMWHEQQEVAEKVGSTRAGTKRRCSSSSWDFFTSWTAPTICCSLLVSSSLSGASAPSSLS